LGSTNGPKDDPTNVLLKDRLQEQENYNKESDRLLGEHLAAIDWLNKSEIFNVRETESIKQKLITEEFDNPSQIAHEICLLLSVDGLPIPETFFKLYTANLDIEPSILYNAVAYFSGAGFLNIACDCYRTNTVDHSDCGQHIGYGYIIWVICQSQVGRIAHSGSEIIGYLSDCKTIAGHSLILSHYS
jgi:hypothetical protein